MGKEINTMRERDRALIERLYKICRGRQGTYAIRKDAGLAADELTQAYLLLAKDAKLREILEASRAAINDWFNTKLRNHMNKRINEAKLANLIAWHESFPLNVNGKATLAALRELEQVREAMLKAYDACARAMPEGPHPARSRCPLCILGRALAAEGRET